MGKIFLSLFHFACSLAIASGGGSLGGGGGGTLASLNGLVDAVQTFATGTSGTDFNISSAAATHTFNIPDAAAGARGLVTTGTQTMAGAKTFSTSVTSPIFQSSTANPSTTGIGRFANIDLLGWRNAANSANITFGLNASNNWAFSSGQFDVPLGSVTAPTYSFTGDLDTGVYSSGADTLDIATNGVGHWRVGLSGHLNAVSDNTIDIGGSGASRPRSIYAGTSIIPALGSAAAPSYTFQGDTNNGWYSPGADRQQWATEGVARTELTAAGNFGAAVDGVGSIGTSVTANRFADIFLSNSIRVGTYYVSPGVFDAGACSAATEAIDWANGTSQIINTLGATCTITISTNPTTNAWHYLYIKQDGTGYRQPTWPTINWIGRNDVVPTLSGANLTDRIACFYDGTNWDCDATLYEGGNFVRAAVAPASAVSLTTATTANITSLAIPPGDWQVCAAANFIPGAATSVSQLILGVSVTTATLPADSTKANPTSGEVKYLRTQAASIPVGEVDMSAACYKVSLTATTTHYLVAQSTFTISTMTVNGFIEARRMQ